MVTHSLEGERRPSLPELTEGVQLLECPETDPVEPLCALVADHVLSGSGPALWVGADTHGAVTTLRELAPGNRVLDRVRIARGFTPYQHTELLRALPRRAAALDASLLVVPGIDARYREDVRGRTGKAMFLAAVADLARAARETGAAVLVTRTAADEFAAPVAALAERTVEYRDGRAGAGPRFVADGHETLVYRIDDEWVQTTLAFWREVLAARRPAEEPATATTAAP